MRNLLTSTVLLAAVACGAGAPPDLTLPAWIEEAERDTSRWQAAIVWCDERPEHDRCQRVLRAKGELLLRQLLEAVPPPPNYDDGIMIPVVPPGFEPPPSEDNAP